MNRPPGGSAISRRAAAQWRWLSGTTHCREGEAPAEPHPCRERFIDPCCGAKMLASDYRVDQRSAARQEPRRPRSSPVFSQNFREPQGQWRQPAGKEPCLRNTNAAATDAHRGADSQPGPSARPLTRTWEQSGADFRAQSQQNTAEGDVQENAASGYAEAEGSFTVEEPGSGGAPRSNSKALRCSGLSQSAV
jgi:hypothetical protein